MSTEASCAPPQPELFTLLRNNWKVMGGFFGDKRCPTTEICTHDSPRHRLTASHGQKQRKTKVKLKTFCTSLNSLSHDSTEKQHDRITTVIPGVVSAAGFASKCSNKFTTYKLHETAFVAVQTIHSYKVGAVCCCQEDNCCVVAAKLLDFLSNSVCLAQCP